MVLNTHAIPVLPVLLPPLCSRFSLGRFGEADTMLASPWLCGLGEAFRRARLDCDASNGWDCDRDASFRAGVGALTASAISAASLGSFGSFGSFFGFFTSCCVFSAGNIAERSCC
jgi:hypothetical protein